MADTITLEDIALAHQQFKPQPQATVPDSGQKEKSNLQQFLDWDKSQQSDQKSPLTNIKPAKIAGPSGDLSDKGSYQRYAIGAALQRDLDPIIAMSMLQQESSWNPQNHGGLGNFTPPTAASRKLDWAKLHSDPRYAIDSSFDYLKELTDKNGGDIQKGLLAYNGGGDPQYLPHVLRHTKEMNQVYNRHLPSLMDEISQGAQQETVQSSQVPTIAAGAQSAAFSPEGLGRLAVGAGETALSLGTGLVSWPITQALKYGRIAREAISPLEVGRKGVYQDAINQAKQLQEQFTYSPRTEVGQAIGSTLGKPIEWIGQFAGKVEQWAKEDGWTDEHAALIRDAVETVGILDFGALTGKALGKVRPIASRFRSVLNKSIEQGHPSPELTTSAQKFNEAVNAVPEIAEQKGKLVEEAKASEAQLQEPTPGGTNETAQGTQQGELPPEVAAAIGRPNQPSLLPAAGSTEIPGIAGMDLNRLSVGFFEDPNVPQEVKQAALQEILAQRGRMPQMPENSTVEDFNNPLISEGDKRVALQNILNERGNRMSPVDEWLSRPAQQEGVGVGGPTTSAPLSTEVPPQLGAEAPTPSLREERQLPSYLQEALDRSTKLARDLGVTGDIERLAAEGKVAGEIASELKDKFPASMSLADVREVVRAVRSELGIPSQEQASEFAQWKQNYEARKNAIIPREHVPSDQTFYHGTTSAFEKFRRNPEGIWFTDNPEFAGEVFAMQEGGNIRPAYLDINNAINVEQPMTKSLRAKLQSEFRPDYGNGVDNFNTFKDVMREVGDSGADFAKAVRVLKSEKYDGIIDNDISTRPDMPARGIAAFRPSQVRGVFSDTTVLTSRNEVVDQSPATKSPAPEGVVSDQGVRIGVRSQRGPRTRQLDLGSSESWSLLRKENVNPNEPTGFTPEEKINYINEVTRPMPEELRSRIEQSIEAGIDISDQLGKDVRQPVRIEYSLAGKEYREATQALQALPESQREGSPQAQRAIDAAERWQRAKDSQRLADQFKESLERERQGIGESSDRNPMDILKDLLTLFWEWEIDPNELGMNVSNIHLSRRQRMALQRLRDDGLRAGMDIGDFLEAAGYGGAGSTLDLQPAHLAAFKNYLNALQNPPPPDGIRPANMRLDAQAMSGDPVVAQRKDYPKGTKFPQVSPNQPQLPGMPQGQPTNQPLRTYPPIYSSEAQGMYAANEIPARPLRIKGSDFGLELPLYTLRKAGLQDLLGDAYRKVNKAGSNEAKQIVADLGNIRKATTMESRANIAVDALSRDAEGQQILSNLKRSALAGLTPNEQLVSSHLENLGQELFDKVNKNRTAIGLDQLTQPDDIFRFVRTWNVLAQLEKGVNLLHDSPARIDALFRENSATPFPKTFTQKRLGMSYELDVLSQFERFSDRVTRQSHFAPFVGKLNELINENLPNPNGVVDPKTGQVPRDWSLQAEKPELWRWLNDWKNSIQGRTDFRLGTKADPGKYDRILRKLDENIAHGIISGNIGPALAQVTSLPKVAMETNPWYTLRALELSMEDVVTLGKTGHRDAALRESNVLSPIKANQMYGDLIDSFNPDAMKGIGQALREGRLRDVKNAVGKGGGTPIQFLDIETSIIAYNAAKMYGAEKLGLSGRDLIRYADDVVVRTQHVPGIGDRAPIQRSQLGRTLTLFQGYTIKEWNWLTRDVLGYDNPSISNKQALKNVLVLSALYAGWNTLSEDVFHVPSALPTPIRDAMRAAGRSPNVFHFGQKEHEAKNPLQIAGAYLAGLTRVPILSGSRYGKGVMGPTITNLTQDLVNNLTGKNPAIRPSQSGVEQAVRTLEPVNKMVVPFTSQIMKIWRSYKKEQSIGQVFSPWDRLINPPEPPQSGGSRDSISGRGGRSIGTRGARR